MEGTRLLEILAIISFFILLLASIFMLYSFYVCDSLTCKSFNQADNVAQRGTKEYILALLGELYNDGIWPLPYIGAAILTPLSLWFVGAPITVRNFAIVFLTSFLVIYCLFSFLGHHYIRVISLYIADYIEDNCPGPNNNGESNELNDNLICDKSEIEAELDTSDKQVFESHVDESQVTFAAPVNVF